MKRIMTTALITLALAGGSVAAIPAMAQVGISVGGVGIAFGYSDGYWDRAHHWHHWRNRREATEWRAANADHYSDMRHDRAPGGGWRDEHYWENH